MNLNQSLLASALLASSFVCFTVAQVAEIDVRGYPNPGGINWADSYLGTDGKCYCDISTYDHDVGDIVVEVKNGYWWRIQDVCESLTPSGISFKEGTSIIYNDNQCGNGPPNNNGDEHLCPGRVDQGRDGCGVIGPAWDISGLDLSDSSKNMKLTKPSNAHQDIRAVVDVVGMRNPKRSWADSYSRNGRCYCVSKFGADSADTFVETSLGWKKQKEICDILGRGPGKLADTPIYNDLQCGNGPSNSMGDEHRCPGRVDMGGDGCGHIGPKWVFNNLPANDPCTDCPDLETVFDDLTDPSTTHDCAWLKRQSQATIDVYCVDSADAFTFCTETCGTCTVPSSCSTPPPTPRPTPRPTPNPTPSPTPRPTPRPTPFPSRAPVKPSDGDCVDAPGEHEMGNKFRTCKWLSIIVKEDAKEWACTLTDGKKCKKTCGLC
mmetsp:Transcript_15527/g.22828  ORF Transcript_15527/g.22828 Transcript_15527/m.22828 type:complete len:434 (-) Transcript_15527:193-1494(-)